MLDSFFKKKSIKAVFTQVALLRFSMKYTQEQTESGWGQTLFTAQYMASGESNEMHQAIFTLYGDRQFVRLAGQFIITSTIVVPVLKSSDPVADGKL